MIPPSEPRPALSKPTSVVLIDDHTMVRTLLGDVLEEKAALKLVGNFPDLKEGIAGCLRLRPKLIIIDWKLSDGTGIELVRALKPKLPETRFLFLSGMEQGYIVRTAHEAQVSGFVMKQAHYDTLLHAVQRVLAGKKYYCPRSMELLLESLDRTQPGSRNGPTPRQWEILQGVVRGDPIKKIASDLGISAKTVYNQFGLLKDKLGIYDIPGLIRYAQDHGRGPDA